MPAVNVHIHPEILVWALSQVTKEKLGKKLTDNIKYWLDGSKTPTFRQIEELSKKTYIPLGYFFLKKPPVEEMNPLRYRTLNSSELRMPSRDLIDTIFEMGTIQEWMTDYRKERQDNILEVPGSLKGHTDAYKIAKCIRKDLGLSVRWYEKCSNASDAFYKIRNLLEQCGILVIMSGIVGKNTHRSLNINEFRAFAMTNEWAPLIFINSADSLGGRLFSLLHEVVHIWMGESNLYTGGTHFFREIDPVEITCNAAAAELAVPKLEFKKNWEQNQNSDIYAKIKEAASVFHCSEIVLARRALDNKKIDLDLYEQVVSDTIKAYSQSRKKKNHGGNYYKNAQSRLDRAFVRALCESINNGKTSYTEAYRLTNTSSKTFDKVVRGLGGVLW